jgi:hypothetical protein
VTIVLFMMPPFYWASFCSRFGLNRSHFLFLPQPTFASSAAHIVVRVCNADWWPKCSLVDLNLQFSAIVARDKGFPDNDYACARETFRTISGGQTASKMIVSREIRVVALEAKDFAKNVGCQETRSATL